MIKLGEYKKKLERPICYKCGKETNDDAALDLMRGGTIYCYACAVEMRDHTWSEIEQGMNQTARAIPDLIVRNN